MSQYQQIMKDGLWNNNVVFAQMLALCPTMAVTSTATNGLGMGMATTCVLASSNLIISLLRNVISNEVRIPAFVLMIASLVTLMSMALNAWLHPLYKVLGLFIALIVVNCAILGRAEAFASKNGPIASLFDGLTMGLGFTMALTIIGGVREIIGSGTLFSQASLLLGPSFKFLSTTVIPDYRGFLIMVLPPGGFLALGFLLALKRLADQAQARRAEARKKAAAASLVLEPVAAEQTA